MELSASLWNTDFIDKACQLHTFMSFLYSLPLNEIHSSCPLAIISCSKFKLKKIYTLPVSKFSLSSLRGLEINEI